MIKKVIQRKFSVFLLCLVFLAYSNVRGQAPESISVLEFDDKQTLFVGDSYGGYIYAYPMNEPPQKEGVSFNIRELDSKIANALGTKTNRIKITDLTVKPCIEKCLHFST